MRIKSSWYNWITIDKKKKKNITITTRKKYGNLQKVLDRSGKRLYLIGLKSKPKIDVRAKLFIVDHELSLQLSWIDPLGFFFSKQ